MRENGVAGAGAAAVYRRAILGIVRENGADVAGAVYRRAILGIVRENGAKPVAVAVYRRAIPGIFQENGAGVRSIAGAGAGAVYRRAILGTVRENGAGVAGAVYRRAILGIFQENGSVAAVGAVTIYSRAELCISQTAIYLDGIRSTNNHMVSCRCHACFFVKEIAV